MTKGKSTTKATARQAPRNIPTKPGFYWVKFGRWQPCEIRDRKIQGLANERGVWFLGAPQVDTLEELVLMGRAVEWGPEIKPPVASAFTLYPVFPKSTRIPQIKRRLSAKRGPEIMLPDAP